MTQQQKQSFIREMALELSKQYKKEGYLVELSACYEMAKEVFEANQADFEI